ncbi:MAG: glycine reductase [Firmicutes bacterium]|nr:glycine reductase [Bacillota bacterium]
MNYPVIKGTAYALIHTPTLLVHMGTTQTVERQAHPDSEYLKLVPERLRSFEDTVNYAPNQVYIGNNHPSSLKDVPMPWWQNSLENAERDGKYGEIMPEDEFLGLVKIVDSFDLVLLEESFLEEIKPKLAEHPLFDENDLKRLGKGTALSEVENQIKNNKAEALYIGEKVVGCVKRAHETDQSLTAHIMTENLVAKASGTLAFKHLIVKNDLDVKDVEYIIECSEEACGDMNQRGGGNFAKAIGEMVGAVNATGADMRSFCAGPAHTMVAAAALVQAGVYKNVVVVAGGATAKLGMNGRDHVKKDMPLLEDNLGAFAVMIGQNDGVNPIIRTDIVGRHVIGSGSAPQAVMQALVLDPLQRADLTIPEIEMYAAELQNPDVTVPAGAGDVPQANYKMIAALAVMKQMLESSDVATFGDKHGMPGFAPTQGHIPSGVPFLGHARDMMLAGDLKNAMIIGKGSLFLARLTNLFDGVSFVIEANTGLKEEEVGLDKEQVRDMIAEAMREFANSLSK